MINFHPALPFLILAILAPFLNDRLRRPIQLAVPLITLMVTAQIAASNPPSHVMVQILGLPAFGVRFDKLSLLFVYTFCIFAFLAHLYSLHSNDKKSHIASNLYIASSLGAVLAPDLISLFIFWEIMAIASALLIFNKDRAQSLPATFRYLLMHIAGGLFFFSGLIMKLTAQQPMTFDAITLDLAGIFIFTGFCINAAIVPLHAWLPDAYSEGTPTNSIYLSAFTTKVAVYVLARGFAGQEILIVLGAISAVYGVIFALMENDMRKLLSYHIVCQIGYMICGIGIGSELGINAGTGHAVGNILFKGLLFMATGALIHMTGKYKLSDLGGMAKNNKLLVGFYMIGALAISGAPFLNGYITKSLLLKSVLKAHYGWLELLLLAVAVGTFLSIGLKLAYFAFWAKPKGTIKRTPIPSNMNLAMFILSAICIAIGVYPKILYNFLPFAVKANVYSADHILHTAQLLLATYLGFILIRSSLSAKTATTLDIDWFYRRGINKCILGFSNFTRETHALIQEMLSDIIERTNTYLNTLRVHGIASVGTPLLLMMISSLGVGIAFIVWMR